jgi:hypothetical protein
VARRDARQHGAGQRRLARTASPVVTAASDRVVGTPSAAMASLTMYSRSTGPERGAAVAAAGEGRRPGALELDVAPDAVPPHHLAEQDGAPVAELGHEVAELVPGVGERDRLRAFGHAVAGKDLHAFGAGQFGGIEPEEFGQAGVDAHKPGAATGVGSSRAKKRAGRRA